MKNFLNAIACVVILVVAAFVGEAFGFFKLPMLENASQYEASTVAWAKNGFKGSPLDAMNAAATTASNASQDAARQADATQKKAELTHLISESKARAVAKYPDLAVANTEMNSRFVFRYNWLTKENSSRLQEPNWPETLAEECAAAAKVHGKSSVGSVAAGAKKLVASAVPAAR